MAPAEEMQTAMVNRSIRTIKAELEYLCDASVITPQVLSNLLSQIPSQTALHAPISVGAVPSATAAAQISQPPSAAMNNLNLQNSRTNSAATNNFNEKQNYYNPPAQSPQPPPPAYNTPPPPQANWPALAEATALYAYSSPDAGDLELQPNDRVNVTEYMNAEWWKGKNMRTGREGIFPRSYVRVEEKAAQAPQGSNYGNVPLDVSQVGDGSGKAPNKTAEMGKKFGSKLGNAAIFGAGATIGGNIVNSIF